MRVVLVILGLASMLATGCTEAATGGGPGASSTPVASATPGAPVARAQLAPAGHLRVAFATSAPFVGHEDPGSGQWKGLAISLGTALAAQLGVTLVPMPYADPGQAYQALLSGNVDVVLGPLPGKPDAAAGTEAVVRVEHTYLVASGSALHNVSDVDRQGIRVGSVDGEGHTAFLASHLQQAQLIKFATDAAALAALRAGQIDAYADARPALSGITSQIAGSRLLDGAFFIAGFGFTTLSSHADGATFLESFVASQLSSGQVQRIVASMGVPGVLAGP